MSRSRWWWARFAGCILVPWLAPGAASARPAVVVDGAELTVSAQSIERRPADVRHDHLLAPESTPLELAAIDTVGSTANTSSGNALAKGNAYRVDTDTSLEEVEFWLGFSGSQTLSFYVYESAVELGTYTQIFTSSATLTGVGTAWYASGPMGLPLTTGMYYIVAVSWPGTSSYSYATGDSETVSFGEHVHGHAVGTHPLGPTLVSMTNDLAIYHQRLTTGTTTARSTLHRGRVASLAPGWRSTALPLNATNDDETAPFPLPITSPGMDSDLAPPAEPLLLYRALGPLGAPLGNQLRVVRAGARIDLSY